MEHRGSEERGNGRFVLKGTRTITGEFLQNNWFLIVVFVFFIWMNALARGCWGRGKHERDKRNEGEGHQH